MDKIRFITIAAAALLLLKPASAGAQASGSPENGLQRIAPMELKAVPTDTKVANKVTRKLAASPKNVTAETSDYYGRTIYGSLINSTEWANATITNVPYGIYSFEMEESPAPVSHITNMSYNFYSGAYNRGKYFGITALSVMGALNGARYITIDTEAWTETSNILYGTEQKSYALLPSAMAYNPVDNTIYSLQYKDDLSGLDWCVYNEEYDEMDKIASFRGQYNVITLAAMPDGEMYFINSFGDLYKINRKTGRPTFVGMTGTAPVLYSQCMMYDNRTGRFLWAAQTDEGSVMYAVDPETAETQKVLDFKNNEQFTAIWTTADEAKDDAPAQVKDLKLAYSGDGELQGTISFTVPTTTYGGGQLGETTLTVWLDGEIIMQESATPGAGKQIPVTLEEGNHYVAVTLNNDEGYSPVASIYQYAGYDTPQAVGDVTFTSDEAKGENTVSWTAPAGGENGGYIDFDNLTYTIVRMPDSVTVADNYKQTTFTEAVPADMRNYSYRIYAVNNGKRSAYAESEKILCGNAFSVPYNQSVVDEQTFNEFFTVVDGNKDGNTWHWLYNLVRIDINANTYPNGDDWLISPAITMEGGTRYRLTINLKTFSAGYPEDFELYVGTDVNDLSTFKLFDKQEGFELYETYSDYNAEFNIDADGKYYVAMRYLSDASKKGSMMLVTNFAVTKIGATKAPKAPADLSITPGEDDAMQATISFTAPTENLEDGKLAAITKVNVYRNGAAEPVHVFNAPATGTQLSWTDTGVTKVGTNTYSVIAENEYGEGAAAVDSAFVGIYTAPYLETFDTRAAAGLYESRITGIDVEANPYNTWKYDENSKKMSFYAYISDDETKIDAWLYTPMMKLDENAVYAFAYKTNINLYISGDQVIENKVYMGESKDAMTTFIGDMPRSTGYKLTETSHNVVTTEAGKFRFGFNTTAQGLYAYPSVEIDDVSLTYLKSAFSPYMFTDYEAKASADGSLQADLSFNAPETDYHGDKLTGNLKVEVFRGQSPTPVFSKDDVVPGARIEWSDTQAQHGENIYMLVATNQYGRSEVLTDTLFVGRDLPATVASFTGRASNDNMDAVLAWEAPATGVNGGVIVPGELSYNVYLYNPDDQSLTPIKTGVKETTLTIENEGMDKQEVIYYAVSAVNTEGESQAVALALTLGQLYQLPFNESFAGMQLHSEPWQVSTSNSYAFNWGLDNPAGAYNDATPQDGDGGVAYMYNANMYESFGGAVFISPKVKFEGSDVSLKFWVYNMATNYPDNKPVMNVYVNADDAGYALEGAYTVGSDTEEGWKQYEIPLDKYAGASHMSFAFEGLTGGGYDVIYLDNIEVAAGSPSGIDNPADGGKTIESIRLYDVSGREVGKQFKGIAIRTVTYTDGSRDTQKVMMK